MKLLGTEKKWKRAAILAVAGICLFGAAALAEDSKTPIQYPVKRIVRGMIMSAPASAGRGGYVILDVNEKLYHVTSQTIMVDEYDRKTDLNHFKQGGWVYMVVELYSDHKDALFIAPISGPDQDPAGNNEEESRP